MSRVRLNGLAVNLYSSEGLPLGQLRFERGDGGENATEHLPQAIYRLLKRVVGRFRSNRLKDRLDELGRNRQRRAQRLDVSLPIDGVPFRQTNIDSHVSSLSHGHPSGASTNTVGDKGQARHGGAA